MDDTAKMMLPMLMLPIMLGLMTTMISSDTITPPSSQTGAYGCPICNYTTNNKEELYTHLLNSHPPELIDVSWN